MIASLNIPAELELTDDELRWAFEEMLNVLAGLNAQYFRRHPDAPCCLDCGSIRYKSPPMSRRQTFPSAPDILRKRKCGCAGAACYVAGMALAKGEEARVIVTITAPGDFHAVVRYPDGRETDPSATLPR